MQLDNPVSPPKSGKEHVMNEKNEGQTVENELANEAKEEARKLELFRQKKNEASKRMIERKKSAIALLVNFANKMGGQAEKEAAKYLTSGMERSTKTAEVLAFLEAKGPTSENDIFFNFKLGRSEMKAMMKREKGMSFNDGKYTFVEVENEEVEEQDIDLDNDPDDPLENVGR